MMSRQQRRERILELLSRNQIVSQEQLQELLRVEGITATQATISRDLRDLGVTKRAEGYVLIDIEQLPKVEAKELRTALRASARSIERAASLVVIQTEPGEASSVVAQVTRSGLPQCVGAIAGEDVVFIATRSAGQAGVLQRMLQRLLK